MTRPWLWDLIESICEDVALTSHIEEKLRGSENKVEIEQLKLMLKETLDLRREKMSYLLENGENPNPGYHCLVKHSLGSFWRQMEIWEATLDDEDLERLKKNGKVLAMALSLYLGMEFQICERCLGDLLAVREYETRHNDTIDTENEGD